MMKIIIDIDEDIYVSSKNNIRFTDEQILDIDSAIYHGTVLTDNVVVLSREVADKMFPPYYKYEDGIVKESKE